MVGVNGIQGPQVYGAGGGGMSNWQNNIASMLGAPFSEAQQLQANPQGFFGASLGQQMLGQLQTMQSFLDAAKPSSSLMTAFNAVLKDFTQVVKYTSSNIPASLITSTVADSQNLANLASSLTLTEPQFNAGMAAALTSGITQIQAYEKAPSGLPNLFEIAGIFEGLMNINIFEDSGGNITNPNLNAINNDFPALFSPNFPNSSQVYSDIITNAQQILSEYQ